MQTYELTLSCNYSTSFKATKALNTLDIDTNSKFKHSVKINNVNIKENDKIGCIVGASGSGKTTLANKYLSIEKIEIDENVSVIDALNKKLSYEESESLLLGVGLTSVPCWVKPINTLSNGQKYRAITAIKLSYSDEIMLDEWTSVVDRQTAMATCVSIRKYLLKNNKKCVFVGCHKDVLDWLKPDWVIDCDDQTFKRDLDIEKKTSNFTLDNAKEKLGEISVSITI